MLDSDRKCEGLSRSARMTILWTVAAAALGVVCLLLPGIMARRATPGPPGARALRA